LLANFFEYPSRIYSNKRRGAYLIFRVSSAALIQGQHLFERLIPQRQNILIVQFNLPHEYFFMAYRLEANLSFGFHNNLINTFLQVFNNSSLDVNVLTVAESSQDLTSDYSVFLSSYGNTQISAAPELRHLFEGCAY